MLTGKPRLSKQKTRPTRIFHKYSLDFPLCEHLIDQLSARIRIWWDEENRNPRVKTKAIHLPVDAYHLYEHLIYCFKNALPDKDVGPTFRGYPVHIDGDLTTYFEIEVEQRN